MAKLNDHELLAEYANRGSEEAFATLVNQHINLVYSTALRCTGQAQYAEEIVRAVFIILARKAGRLSRRVSVSGWLYQTARLTAANLTKKENRRMRREQEAYMQSTLEDVELEQADPAVWGKIAPLLEEAMGRLGATDRQVVVLRYFQNQSAAEIGAELRMTEATVRQRAGRALEKLRRYFGQSGTILSGATIATLLSRLRARGPSGSGQGGFGDSRGEGGGGISLHAGTGQGRIESHDVDEIKNGGLGSRRGVGNDYDDSRGD